MPAKRHIVTAALPYTNGPVHIGHLAGVYLPADIYTRYLRQKGKDVLFVCGSDEHGVPIMLRARKEGIFPQDLVNKYHALIQESFKQFGIAFDVYSRTSSKTHHQTASEFFKKLHHDGVFQEKVQEQYFDPEEKQFLADRYITGTCPRCSHPSAYGDQCENCGSSLSPQELIEPKSALSGAKPVLKETKHWFLPLDQHQDFLSQWILKEHKDWKPNVYGQCKSWLDQGLQARAVTRDLDWGVPVPISEAKGKVLYVWFDAPIGYISATRDWAQNIRNQANIDPKTGTVNGLSKENSDWNTWWQSPDSRLVHFIGKDNIVFHCIIFPAMLKAHGGYNLPENVPANEFLNLEGQKISTSRNWAVWLHEYLEEFKDQQDVLRYTLCATLPETKDNDFTWKDFQTRNNSELVAIFGNFVNRVVVLTHKYFEGKVPELKELQAADRQVLEVLGKAPERIGACIENYKFRDALAEFMNLARAGNKYLADEEPWKKWATDKDRVGTILNTSVQIAAGLAILAEPFLPFTARKLQNMLNIGSLRRWQGASKDPLDQKVGHGPKDTRFIGWDQAGQSPLLSQGSTLGQAVLLFSKIEDPLVELQRQKLKGAPGQGVEQEHKKEPSQETMSQSIPMQKELCTFEDFMKMDLRVGTILTAKKVEGADKLLEFTVDTGVDQRTIVSGIAQQFNPEELVGKQVTVLLNLAPRKIRGVESQGMILLAEDQEGRLSFVLPHQPTTNGSVVR